MSWTRWLWTEQLPDLVAFAEGDILVAHNAGFDMGVIRTACEATFVDTPIFEYACSLQVARKTYSLDSYRLPVAAMAAGFEDFEHHNALADAQACAAIMIHAAKRHEVADIPGLVSAVNGKLGAIGTVPRVEPASRVELASRVERESQVELVSRVELASRVELVETA